ncbi:MAG TPA: RHS repeat-associated core domain-containing protein, partial [Candidatus Acidoferrales bacterium]|nr:RHS repeat-associated core domain-containing protein [Candidatus Acidoferrales bacterium]
TNDGLNTISYDGEGRAVTASGGLGSGTYSYDGNGLRVEKVAGSTTTVYIFSGSKVIAEYAGGAAPSSPTREYIYAGGALLARIDSSGTNYYHQDHLSNRMVTNSSGSVVAEMGHFPFGESWYNATNDKLYFTTYEYDSESGNHYAMARYHVSRLGRLSAPDPIAGSTANPQSLNRYSYSINDPANATDPSGADPVSGCTTAETKPKDQSQQASGGGHSDTDNSDADTDGGDADSPQQNGCVSHVNPFGSGGDFGSDWAAEFGVEGVGTFDGGPPMADIPPGMFTVTSIGGKQGIGNWIWLPSDTIQTFQQDKGQPNETLMSSTYDPGEWLELGVPSAPGDSSDGNNGSSWWGTFAKSFFTFAGGPGNVPTCAGQALRHMGEILNPFTPGVSTAADAAAPVAQAAAINRGVAQTQAGIDAYIATRGLTVPLRSSVVRAMAVEGGEGAVAAGARANFAVQTAAVDYAAVKSGYLTSKEALSGQCAAAFPIF